MFFLVAIEKENSYRVTDLTNVKIQYLRNENDIKIFQRAYTKPYCN